MQIGAQIEWRKDCYGHEAQALYLGDLCVGSILHSTHRTDGWRGWFSNDDEGNETGWFNSAEEARTSVEKTLFAAIKFEAA
jgi:hypothetical protein